MQRTLEIETPEAVAFAYPLAGLGSRGLAALLDVIMLTLIIIGEVLLGGLSLFLFSRVSGQAFDVFTFWVLAVLILIVFITYWGYYIVGEVFRNGRTFGKRIVRIRVVREDGSRVGVLESVVRNVVRIIDLMPATYGFGVAAVLLSAKSQRLGDMAAGTIVIEEPRRLSELKLDVHGQRAVLVRDYLARRSVLTTDARWQVGVTLLQAYGEQPRPGWDETIVAGRLADLAYAREGVA